MFFSGRSRPFRQDVDHTSKTSKRRPPLRFRAPVAGLAALSTAVLSAVSMPAAAAPPIADRTSRYIVVLKDSVTSAATTAEEQSSRYGIRKRHVITYAFKGYIGDMTAAAARAVSREPAVQFVSADRKMRRLPPQPQQSTEVWPYPMIRVGAKRTNPPPNVNVAVIDSGIDSTHPDLNVAGGVDCTSGRPVIVVPTDPFGHGTFVAGVVGARANNFGIVGVASGTPLWSARVVDQNGAIAESSIVCAVDWVTSTRRDTNPSNDIAVANISLTGEGSEDGRCGLLNHDPLHLAICRSVARGVTYAVAAGNDGADIAQHIPSAYNEVLTATAMADFDGRPGGLAQPAPVCAVPEEDDTEAFFSNYATRRSDKAHTIAAPGVCVASTVPGGYAVDDGTSFSSPIVAGTVAMCIRSGKCRSGHGAANMARVLADTARYNITHPGYGYQGDPLRPIPGRYYGFLVYAGLY
ncbi:S8 family serine peptidase [Streptomyces sp. V1I6]|uniref:S8 family peptidase n=1 Tax=Streptomyces sp. V1I6 TaxID=3042273 RepID=UPI00277E24B2|nr:S8 family serine peptidase [Streptomyces sp. V1I6]MDQ0846938.1 subtilisin [Streptomyces sp. V1I6]